MFNKIICVALIVTGILAWGFTVTYVFKETVLTKITASDSIHNNESGYCISIK